MSVDITDERCGVCGHLKWVHGGEKYRGFCCAVGCCCTEPGFEGTANPGVESA